MVPVACVPFVFGEERFAAGRLPFKVGTGLLSATAAAPPEPAGAGVSGVELPILAITLALETEL